MQSKFNWIRIGLTMNCFPACVYLYLLLNLNFPDIVYGYRNAFCVRCFCKARKSNCELENGRCTCIHDRMYLNNSTRCAHRHEDCGLHTYRTRVKPGCLPCQCSRGSDQCDLIGSECTCRDGSIYFMGSANRCVRDIDECTTLYSITSTCAKCTCPRGQKKCSRPGNKCECIHGKYYMPDSDECVRNDEDCIFPSPFIYGHNTCAKCLCPPHQKRCHLFGNKCDCIDGIYYMRGSKKCVQNRADCIFGSPTRPCAECTCPRGRRKCNLLGNKCDCINGKYYMPGSNECVKNDEHCIIPSHFRRAEVDSNETAVIIVQNDR